MTEQEETHEHDWQLPEGGYFVVATYPEKRPYHCACGAFTHDPLTGATCSICAPEDHRRRSDDLIVLVGGPFDGATIVRPINRSVLLRCDPPDEIAQKIVRYDQTDDDRDVWLFLWNNWTQPFMPREPTTLAAPSSSEGGSH